MNNILDEFPYKIAYKSRDPDPGECTVIAIDYEKKRLDITNGSVRLYPYFEEIKLITPEVETTTYICDINGDDDLDCVWDYNYPEDCAEASNGTQKKHCKHWVAKND